MNKIKIFDNKEFGQVRTTVVDSVSKTVKVTGAGQQYFINLFLGMSCKAEA